MPPNSFENFSKRLLVTMNLSIKANTTKMTAEITKADFLKPRPYPPWRSFDFLKPTVCAISTKMLTGKNTAPAKKSKKKSPVDATKKTTAAIMPSALRPKFLTVDTTGGKNSPEAFKVLVSSTNSIPNIHTSQIYILI